MSAMAATNGRVNAREAASGRGIAGIKTIEAMINTAPAIVKSLCFDCRVHDCGQTPARLAAIWSSSVNIPLAEDSDTSVFLPSS
jgi:hypothetical protein